MFVCVKNIDTRLFVFILINVGVNIKSCLFVLIREMHVGFCVNKRNTCFI